MSKKPQSELLTTLPSTRRVRSMTTVEVDRVIDRLERVLGELVASRRKMRESVELDGVLKSERGLKELIDFSNILELAIRKAKFGE